MATAIRVVSGEMEAPEFAQYADRAGKSWFKVWFQAGDPDTPHVDFHVVRAANPVEARCRVERHERGIARALGSKSDVSPDSIHAISVDVLAEYSHGAVDG